MLLYRLRMVIRFAWFSVLASSLVGCLQQPADEGAGNPGGKGDIWGEDDRKERYEIESAPLRHAAQASAATWLLSELEHDATRDVWSAKMPKTLAEDQTLCDGERFATQPAAAWCSATLITDDIMVSAGHCFDASNPCSSFAVVFDYAYDSAPTDPMLAAKDIPAANVYTCAEMLATKFAVDFGTEKGPDYAVFRLDRKVTGREPAAVNWSGTVEMGKPAYVIGHPARLPQKLASGVVLDGASNPEIIVHDADVFGGNSGCGLFDATGTLIGIHSRSSAQRYIQVPPATCKVAAVCGENATCDRKPTAYDPRALKNELTPELRTRLGIPAM
jgi:hypothetical protein